MEGSIENKNHAAAKRIMFRCNDFFFKNITTRNIIINKPNINLKLEKEGMGATLTGNKKTEIDSGIILKFAANAEIPNVSFKSGVSFMAMNRKKYQNKPIPK
ncbi:MAG: hypothetical protein Fur0028_13550 [Bacteroidales bacterium]